MRQTLTVLTQCLAGCATAPRLQATYTLANAGDSFTQSATTNQIVGDQEQLETASIRCEYRHGQLFVGYHDMKVRLCPLPPPATITLKIQTLSPNTLSLYFPDWDADLAWRGNTVAFTSRYLESTTTYTASRFDEDDDHVESIWIPRSFQGQLSTAS